MKKINLLLAFIVSSIIVSAQAPASPIREGAVLVYNVYPEGGELQSELLLERISPDTVVIGWSIPASMRSGRRTMAGSSLQTSKMGFWEPPFTGEDILIPADQSMLVLSKAVYMQAKTVGRMQYDGLQFVVANAKASVFEASGLKLPAIEMKSESGMAHIWLLDNPEFPIILKYEGNPFYVDIQIVGVR
jgi:hypothetical protein